jgi:hypothetical protein
MKQKTFYILAVICCLSFMSSAKQGRKQCDGICKNMQSKCPTQALQKAKEKPGYDFSPLTSFIINL